MKHLNKVALSIIIVLFVLWLKNVVHERFGELAALSEQINSQVELVNQDNQTRNTKFDIDGEATLVISPPYADLKELGYDSDSALLEKMQSEVNAVETGHLFIIQNERILDHRLLSGYAEPILGKAQGKKFIFTISKMETSGRPVRIELKDFQNALYSAPQIK